jgi:adenylyl-sulfate kinase
MKLCLWFTGLPCSGKTTIAKELLKYYPNAVLLDGDEVRSKFYGDEEVGFSHLDRHHHLLYMGKLAKFLVDQGQLVICSFITPINKTQEDVRKKFNSGEFIEIYLNTPVKACINRDVKGMYKAAMEGKIKNFTGINDLYEEPKNPEITLDTSVLTVNECVTNIINYIESCDLNRKVGAEAQREYKKRVLNGFFSKYLKGTGLDIGFCGYKEGKKPILSTAIGVDLDYPNYDGINLPFKTDSQDYVFSSHTLEHITDYKNALREWHRVLGNDCYMVITVPHQYAYEKKKELPSKWNGDHKRFYTVASLVKEIEESLEPNSYRIISARDNINELIHMYPPDKHSDGPYEVELVLQKINKPDWDLL